MKPAANIAALTIAGSDPGAGAGIQADLKTFSALGVYGTTVVTAVTAQNLQGVTAVSPVDPVIVEKQLIAVLEGFPVKAFKTGMLFSARIIETIARILKRFPGLPMVIDPVIASTSGYELLQADAAAALAAELFPMAALITPNIAEAEILGAGKFKIDNLTDLEQAARSLYERFAVPIFLKGGHLPDKACDVFYRQEGAEKFQADFVKGVNTHGSGCTVSAAITAFLARGFELREAVSRAKSYTTGSLQNPLSLGPGTKIIDHFYK
jgi:hydroxymethylpyrimidine/phosphomethylpyrimidine kinase